MNDFCPLMANAYNAHKEFRSAWDRYYTGAKKPEPLDVTIARDRFNEEVDRVFDQISIYEEDFLAGKSGAIDAILDFLETDIPAFRCGYVKEKYYRRMKSMSLNAAQMERIRNMAFKLCSTESYRREFRDFVRLVIKVANAALVDRIRSLVENSDGIVKFKSQMMLKIVLDNRKDLS